MNPKVALIVGVTIMMAFGFPLVSSALPADLTKTGFMLVIVYVGLVAAILAWAPRQRP